MKHYSLLLLLTLLLFVSCNKESDSVTFALKDYATDTNVDAHEDYSGALTNLLADVATASQKGQAVEIDLGSSTYHFYDHSLPKHELFISNHDHVADRPVAFMLEGFDRLTVKGEGAQLLFHGRVIPFVIKESSDVTLEGFSIDYPRPALSQIEVTALEGNQVTAKVLPETSYRIDDERHFVLLGEGYEQHLNVTMPFSADKKMKWNRADVGFNPEKITDLGDHQLLIEGWQEQEYLKVGDRYVLRSYYRPTPGIVIMDATDTKIEEVTVHYSEGMALIAQHSTNITLDGFSVALDEGSERYFTAQADATHFSGCRGHLEVTDGLFEHMADDAINVHGTYLRVDSLLSDTQLLASFAHGQSFGFSWLEEGDSLVLIDRQTLLPIGNTIGASIEYRTPKEVVLTLASPLNLSQIDTSVHLAVENHSGHPSVRFAENTIRHNRARGALFSTPRHVLCEKNFFDHTHGSAILLCGDANGWYESGPCEDITIQHNHFVNALTARYQFTDGIISISPQMPELVEGAYYHGRVVVRDNKFENFPTPLYFAKSVRQFVFVDNEVVQNDDFKSLFESPESVVINVGEVVLD